MLALPLLKIRSERKLSKSKHRFDEVLAYTCAGHK